MGLIFLPMLHLFNVSKWKWICSEIPCLIGCTIFDVNKKIYRKHFLLHLKKCISLQYFCYPSYPCIYGELHFNICIQHYISVQCATAHNWPVTHHWWRVKCEILTDYILLAFIPHIKSIKSTCCYNEAFSSSQNCAKCKTVT